jgi:hypothetical protein
MQRDLCDEPGTPRACTSVKDASERFDGLEYGLDDATMALRAETNNKK